MFSSTICFWKNIFDSNSKETVSIIFNKDEEKDWANGLSSIFVFKDLYILKDTSAKDFLKRW